MRSLDSKKQVARRIEAHFRNHVTVAGAHSGEMTLQRARAHPQLERGAFKCCATVDTVRRQSPPVPNTAKVFEQASWDRIHVVKAKAPRHLAEPERKFVSRLAISRHAETKGRARQPGPRPQMQSGNICNTRQAGAVKLAAVQPSRTS